MKTLKGQMQLDAVAFLNSDEFGEVIFVDGLECHGIWDEDVQPTKHFASNTDIMGVMTISQVLMVMPKDPEAILLLPVPDQVLNIDDVFWTVQDSFYEAGIFELTIYRNVSSSWL